MTDLVWLLDFLQRIRLQTRDRGTHVLYRLFVHRDMDAVPLSDDGSRDPLLGLSHVAARFVVYVRHVPDQSDHCFRAIALGRNGTGAAFSAGSTGPIVPDVEVSSWEASKLGLYLQRIAWGRPRPWQKYSPEKWVLTASLQGVVDAVERGELTEGKGAVWEANAILQRGIAERIAMLRRAESPSRTIRVEGADDWHTITHFGPFLGAVDWDDLDAETFGIELGYSADTAHWWTARGIGHLAQVESPGAQESLDRLDAVAPQIGSNMWSWTAVVENSVTPHYVSPVERGRRNWKADDPRALLQVVRDTQSARGGTPGTVVIGYRRSETGRLDIIAELEVDSVTGKEGHVRIGPATEMLGPELIAVPELGGADGVLLIDSHVHGWNAVAVNREGEQGQASSDWTDDANQFTEEVVGAEITAALRRILTGHARFDVMCSPIELARRRILYELARAMERANIGADAEIVKAVIDLGLLGQLDKHIVPLLPLEGESKAEWDPDGPTWETINSALRGIRDRISWEDVRLEALAEAWSVPLDEARWWRQEGLAGREAQCIPDETESMIRCATAVGGYTDAVEILEHIRMRAQEVFGEDLPVLWSLVPQPRKMSDPGGTLSA